MSILLQFAALFNNTRYAPRYVNSEVLNITEVNDTIRLGVFLYFAADYFNIIPPEELLEVMNTELIG